MTLVERLAQAKAPPSLRSDSSLLGAALEYAKHGFRVLPVHTVHDGVCSCPDTAKRRGGALCTAKGKHPIFPAWEKLATDDSDTLRRWWSSGDWNIGLAMGGEARLVALDVDGEVGRRSLAAMESRYGLLPPTLTSRSGRLDGGEHRIFRLPQDFDLAKVNKIGFADGLDTRADNAQIVVPPSIHSSGRNYMWARTVAIADMPRWLYEQIVAGRARRAGKRAAVVQAVNETETFDIWELRSHLADYRRKLVGSEDPVDIERRWIAGQILKGEAFSVPGAFEGETELLRGRDAAFNQAMSILAWRLPVEVPVEVAVELIRPSLAATDCEPEGFDHWLTEVVDMFERACCRRDAVLEQEREANRALVQVLNRGRVAAGLSAVSEEGSVEHKVNGLNGTSSGVSGLSQRLLSASKGGSIDDAPDTEASTEVDDDLAIIVTVGELPRMVLEAIQALALRDKNLYQRAGELVTLVREPQRLETYEKDSRVSHDILLRPGTPRIHTVPSPMLMERLALVAKWVKLLKSKKKNGAGQWVELNPDPATVAAVLARKDWPGVRPVRGIIETPVLTPSLQVSTESGYDAETTFVHLPSVSFEPIPDELTQADAQQAMKRVWIELFSDFPFRGLGVQDPNDLTRELRYKAAQSCPDAFVALALLLTILARPAVRGAVPGAVFEASTQGSGKSLQINVVAMVATGRAASLATFPIGREGRPNEEELEKLLGAYALAGVQIIAFDNIKGMLGGPALEKVQTSADTVALRVLGASELRIMPWSAVLAFSGNNMSMSEDVAQRNLLSRLESPLEDPRSRPKAEFRHESLLAWVEAHRASLVRDCLIVLKAWALVKDKPDAGSLGSFEAWSGIVPSAILYAGGPNILEARSRDGASEDSESDAHRTLMKNWQWSEPMKAQDIVKKLFEGETQQQRDNPHSKSVPKGFAELRAAVRELTHTQEGRMPNPAAFGYVLRKLRDKIRDGFKITGKKNREGSVEWRVMKVT